MSVPTSPSTERADLLSTLATHRHFLRFTVRDLSDEQAALHPTASELCLGGLIKHVATVESAWAAFIVGGPAAMEPTDPASAESVLDRQRQFQMESGETLVGLLERYAEVARHTDGLVANLPDFDGAQRLPEAPWFEQGASWSARRVLLHIIAETAQHAGHADILHESLDGSKTMG